MLRLHLLGPPSVEQGGRPVTDFRSQKIEALLYYLAAVPGQHLRSQLAGLLWPDQPDKTALRNLRYALWNIRQVIDAAPLAVDRTTAAFVHGEAVWVDVLEFEQQASARPRLAAELYRADFLSGFELLDSTPFTDWLHRQQTHYRTLIMTALKTLVDHHTSQRQFEPAITASRRLLNIEPWYEKAHRQLMWLLALTGQRAAAIEQFRRCRALLIDELGLEPEPETIALFERIRRGDIDPETRSAKTPAPPAAEKIPFLGRTQEQAWLLSRWQTVERSGSQLALVGGEAGIGKTRLVSETGQTIIEQGGRLLHGRCFEYSGPVAYQPVAEALRPLLIDIKRQPWELSDIWLAELAQWVPELREQYPRLPLPLATDRYRLFEAARQLFRQLTARQPLCLFVDDLHWADPDSLDLLGYLVQQSDRLLVVGTYRPEETLNAHPLLALRDGLYRTNRAAELWLKPLAEPAVARLVEAMGPSPQPDRLTTLLYQISAGNPFILLETLQEIQEQGIPANFDAGSSPNLAAILPQTVHATIQRRLSRLSTNSRQLLSLAALIGREFDADLLQAAGHHPPTAVLDAVDDWLNRHLVRQVQPAGDKTDPLLFDFTHDLVRAVVVQQLSPLRRQALHHQLALALQERRQTAAAEIPVERLAYHFHEANQHRAALDYLQQAGQQARTVYALPLALERYRLAERHWSQQYQADSLTTPLEARRQRWMLLREQAEILRLSGKLKESQQLLDQTATEIDRWGDDAERLQVIVPRLIVLNQLDQLDRCRQLAQKGLQLAAAELDAVAEGECRLALGHCALRDADYTGALGHYEAALINYTQSGKIYQAAVCLRTIARTYLLTNQFEQALDCVREATAYAQTSRQQDVLAEARLLEARILLWMGDLENGLAACKETIEAARRLDLRPVVTRGLALQGYLQLLTGQDSAARQTSQRALELAQKLAQLDAVVNAHFYRGLIQLGLKDPAAAQSSFAEVHRQSHLPEQRQIELLSYRALAAQELGQAEQAVGLTRKAITLLDARQNAVEGVQRIYLNHYHILNAAGEAMAQQALQQAFALAQQQAATISRAEMQRLFWLLPWNQELRRKIGKIKARRTKAEPPTNR